LKLKITSKNLQPDHRKRNHNPHFEIGCHEIPARAAAEPTGTMRNRLDVEDGTSADAPMKLPPDPPMGIHDKLERWGGGLMKIENVLDFLSH
jgi:hypothetical protein